MKEQIKKMRERVGLSQKELAEQMGYQSPSLISMWENGSRKPQSDVIPRLASVLGCEIIELFSTGEERER